MVFFEVYRIYSDSFTAPPVKIYQQKQRYSSIINRCLVLRVDMPLLHTTVKPLYILKIFDNNRLIATILMSDYARWNVRRGGKNLQKRHDQFRNTAERRAVILECYRIGVYYSAAINVYLEALAKPPKPDWSKAEFCI